jgi:hypothetical protein
MELKDSQRKNWEGKRFQNGIIGECIRTECRNYKQQNTPFYVDVFKTICDCGKESTTTSISLKSLQNETLLCDCIKKERRKEREFNRRQPNNLGLTNSVRATYKESAKKRNLSFDLTSEEFNKIVLSDCFYCGSSPISTVYDRRNKDYTVKYNGIDRVDNTKGYSVNNCVPCCKHCNFGKSTSTLEEFKAWINKIKNHKIQWDQLDRKMDCG